MTGVASLLRLASPALPIGAYAWSSGLESAIDAGLVHDAASAETWLGDGLALGFGRWEGPMLWRLLHADATEFARLDARLVASRDTRELRQETLVLGASLMRLLAALELSPLPAQSFPAAWARAAVLWQVAPHEALTAYAFVQLENQLAVLAKLVPLGQVACQRLLQTLMPRLDEVCAAATTLPYDALASSLPGLSMLSAAHETQYSRLFRS